MSPESSLTLTAGNRLARWLHEEHARDALAQGATVWETPDILPWSAWLEKLWDEAIETGAAGAHPPIRLGDGQALALWEGIIREWAGADSLLQPSATAELAQQAWQLVHDWRVPIGIDGTMAEDVRAFSGWSTRYRETCERHHWLDGARLIEALIPLVRAGRLSLPAKILLRGFDAFTPAQRLLLDALVAVGVSLDSAPAPAAAADASRVVLPMWRDEVQAAARFARARLHANPRARIGIVVPDLARHRELVCRIFDDLLAPDTRLPGGAVKPRPYNVSLGRALAEVSPVAEALALLSHSAMLHRTGTLVVESACAWLRSPYLNGAGEEWATRARLERYLREAREPVVTLKYLLHAAQGQGHDLENCPQLAGHLNDWRHQLTQLPKRAMPSQWVPVLTALLAAAGWPGNRPHDSHEHQALEHWRDLLGELRRYDAVTGVVAIDDIVARVQTMARATIFQPQAPMVPVQIVGLLEASGLRFDHLWVLGLQDENWPAAPRPHPFLPPALQRRLGLPHATPERELDYARQRTAQLISAGSEVVFSSARMEGDRLLAPSPLMQDLPERLPEAIGLDELLCHRDVIHRQRRTEAWQDDHAVPLAAGSAPGGTSLFRLQSACPFRAFSELRLHARPAPSTETGLDAQERGTLVHRALEKLWEELGEHSALANLDEAARSALARRVTGEVIEAVARRRPFTFTERFRDLEHERLTLLLDEWLALEQTRSPFRVLARESRRPLPVGPLTVTAAIDRIDVLEDGTLAVTDYKTGDPRPADWFGDRPREPQVPLYALYGTDQPVSALVYARVKRGQCQWRGLSERDTGLPGVKTLAESEQGGDFADGIEARAARQGSRDSGFASWPALHDHWRATLERLATSFQQGAAAVDPRDVDVCKHCHLPSLCRVHELDHRSGRRLVGDDSDV